MTSDIHEWISFDHQGDTWSFDVTFLVSNWACIYGQGCLGVLSEAAEDFHQGCCSYGAHFVDEDDRNHTEAMAKQLSPTHWQFHAEAATLGATTTTNDDGDLVSHLVDDACIFLNRPGFSGGPGCALHAAALAADERPLDWKPEVCWQLPLRLETNEDDNGHQTHVLREWKRRDWGSGGDDFHWWCTDDDRAFVDHEPVYVTMRDEIVELVGGEPYAQMVALIEQRRIEHFLPHPKVRR